MAGPSRTADHDGVKRIMEGMVEMERTIAELRQANAEQAANPPARSETRVNIQPPNGY